MEEYYFEICLFFQEGVTKVKRRLCASSARTLPEAVIKGDWSRKRPAALSRSDERVCRIVPWQDVAFASPLTSAA
jgi:hypothetical protein